jgi:hypothetical protein
MDDYIGCQAANCEREAIVFLTGRPLCVEHYVEQVNALNDLGLTPRGLTEDQPSINALRWNGASANRCPTAERNCQGGCCRAAVRSSRISDLAVCASVVVTDRRSLIHIVIGDVIQSVIGGVIHPMIG